MSICPQWIRPLVLSATSLSATSLSATSLSAIVSYAIVLSAILLTASGCRMGAGPSPRPSLPVYTPAGCSPDTFIARYDAPYLSTASSAAPDFQVTGLYDARTLERLGALVREASSEEHPDAPGGTLGGGVMVAPLAGYVAFSSRSAQLSPELVENLRRTLVLKRKHGFVSSEDRRRLSGKRFSEIELNCSIEALGSMAGGQGRPRAWWHMLRTGVPTVLPVITRRVVSRRAPPVRVAVLDSGIDPEGMEDGHRLLREGEDFARGNAADTSLEAGDSKEGATPGGDAVVPWLRDPLGHGTTVANLIQETAGALVEIISIRVLDARGRGTQADLARGLVSAVIDHRAQLLNLSLGYRRGGGAGMLPRYLIDALATVHGAGARAFAAAGNVCRGPKIAQCDAFYPAAAPWVTHELTLGVTSVSGLDFDGLPGSQVVDDPVDIWAPSQLICSRTSPILPAGGPHFQVLSGSSWAVPQVTGAVAVFLALQQANLERALTAPELDRLQDVILMESARDHLPSTFGTGRDSRIAGCGPASHEGTRLNGKPGGRLNLCYIATALAVSLEACTTWDGDVPALTADFCPVEGGSPVPLFVDWKGSDASIACCGYPEASGYNAIAASPGLLLNAPLAGPASAADQWLPALQCTAESSKETSSLALAPLIAEGQLCAEEPGTFQLEAVLNPEAVNYSAWHLRLAVKGRETWFPLGNLSGYAGRAVAYHGTFAPAIDPRTISDPWLIAADRTGHAWSGAPLLKTNCKGGSR